MQILFVFIYCKISENKHSNLLTIKRYVLHNLPTLLKIDWVYFILDIQSDIMIVIINFKYVHDCHKKKMVNIRKLSL